MTNLTSSMQPTEASTRVQPVRSDAAEAGTKSKPASALHCFVPCRSDRIETESIANGLVLITMLCFAGLLLATCVEIGLVA